MDEPISFRSAGAADLLEYVTQLVVVPRLCDSCLAHQAVYFWMGSWPTSYLCRPCVTFHVPQLLAQPWYRPIGASML